MNDFWTCEVIPSERRTRKDRGNLRFILFVEPILLASLVVFVAVNWFSSRHFPPLPAASLGAGPPYGAADRGGNACGWLGHHPDLSEVPRRDKLGVPKQIGIAHRPFRAPNPPPLKSVLQVNDPHYWVCMCVRGQATTMTQSV